MKISRLKETSIRESVCVLDRASGSRYPAADNDRDRYAKLDEALPQSHGSVVNVDYAEQKRFA